MRPMPEEWTGTSVDDAVERALSELGVPRERVEVEILEEPSEGFMAIGRRDARVRVRLRPGFAVAAKEFVRAVVELVGTPAQVTDPEPTERGVRIAIEGKDAGGLIGRHGQTLDALQQLAELHAARRSGERVSLLLDINDYRERRAEQIVRQAQRAAREALRDGKPRPLEVMTPYERRLAHLALQDMPGVTTESEGEDPYRRVVVHPSRPDAGAADERDGTEDR